MAALYKVTIPNAANETKFMGRVTRDADHRATPNGHYVTNVSIAVSRRYLPQGQTEWQEQTAFYNCAIWGDDAAARARNIKKGDVILVSFNGADVVARAYGEGQASLQISRCQVSRVAYRDAAGNDVPVDEPVIDGAEQPAEAEFPF